MSTRHFLSAKGLLASAAVSALLIVTAGCSPSTESAATKPPALEATAEAGKGGLDLTKLDPKQWVLPPTAQAWADLAKLPDWSGAWTPDEGQQNAETENSPTPWNDKAVTRIKAMIKAHLDGNPDNQNYEHCIPEGMPSWMMIYHNSVEYLFTPGRVTMLGESEGNELRRIRIDGRDHPADPDPTFFGDSIGHWEDGTLVVDTVGVMPEVPLAIQESLGVPNGGDMHIVEHIHLANADELHDDLEITAPHVLTRPWKTTRVVRRQRNKKYEIVEGVCMRGHFTPDTDKFGFPVLVLLPFEEGIPLAPGKK